MTTSNVRSLDIRAFQITFIGLLVLAFAILSFAGVMTAQAQETGPDYCDASQRPAGMSVAEWHEAESFDGSSCFNYQVIQQCGSLDVQLTNDTNYVFSVHYVIGTSTPALANWAGDGELPVNFSEDEYGGSVDVTYYVVGEESDYFVGDDGNSTDDIPNIWEGYGETVTVDTNCEPDDVIVPVQCVAVGIEIVSDGQTKVDGGGNATSTFEHSAWTADDSADFNNADWIWETATVTDPTATTTVIFTRNFNYSGNSATSATFYIATDNSYSVTLNGNAVGSSTDADNYTSASYDTYNVSGDVQTGSNTLSIEVTNFGGDDDPEANPAGLLYKLTIDGEECTADDEVDEPSGGTSGSGGGGSLAPRSGNNNNNDDDDDDDNGSVLGDRDESDNDDDEVSDSELRDMLDDARQALLGLMMQLRGQSGQVAGATDTPGFPNTGDGSSSETGVFGGTAGILAILLALSGIVYGVYAKRRRMS